MIFFTKYIFRSVGYDLDADIPIEVLKEVILKGKNEEAESLFPNGWRTVKPYFRLVSDPSTN